MLAELPPEVVGLVFSDASLGLDDLYFSRLVCRYVFPAASRAFMSRVEMILKEERDPETFCSAVWTIRGDAIPKSGGLVDSPLEGFSLGRLMKAAGMSVDSLITLQIMENFAIEDEWAEQGRLLGGLGITKSDLQLAIGPFLRFPSNEGIPWSELAELLRATLLPAQDLVDVMLKSQAVDFRGRWLAICNLEQWEADLATPEAQRIVSVAGFERMFASAISESDNDVIGEEGFNLSARILRDMPFHLAIAAIAVSPFSWELRGRLVSMMFEDVEVDVFVLFSECLGRLFSNARRDPGVTGEDCALFYDGVTQKGFSHFTTCFFQEHLWRSSEDFEACDFSRHVIWTSTNVKTFLAEVCEDDEFCDATRVAYFFKDNLNDFKAEVVTFFCIYPSYSTTVVCRTVLEALNVAVEDLARITLARFNRILAYGGDLNACLDHTELFLQKEDREPGDNMGFLLASIYLLCRRKLGPLERGAVNWDLGSVRQIAKVCVDRQRKQMENPEVSSTFVYFLSRFLRATFDKLNAKGSSNPHLHLGLIFGHGLEYGLDGKTLTSVFKSCIQSRKMFDTVAEIGFFVTGFLAADSSSLPDQSNPPLYLGPIGESKMSEKLSRSDLDCILVGGVPKLGIRLTENGELETIDKRAESLKNED
jgi:hypothetical protein